MRILVLGASGFLGGKVYHKLLEQKSCQVEGTCYSSKDSNFKSINIKDENAVRELINDCKPHVVLWCLMDLSSEMELIHIGLPNVLRSIGKNTRFIFISTDAFAGGQGGYSEDTPMRYYSIKNPLAGYANAKIDGEEMVKKHKNHVIIRTGPLYGQDAHGSWDKRTAVLVNSLSQNVKVSRSANLYKTFVCVDDLRDLLLEIIESGYNGIIHAGPSQKESYYSYNVKMAEKLGLDENLIIRDIISPERAAEEVIPLDTSMDTSKCRAVFRTNFRDV